MQTISDQFPWFHGQIRKGSTKRGFGHVTTEGLICTCQGHSCSCIGPKDAGCILQDVLPGHCDPDVDIFEDGKFQKLRQ